MERFRRRLPSPALLIACLALFVALGGTVLAATKISGRTIKVKSLPGNRLEVGSVAGNRLAPGTIPGNRIAAGSLKGGQIDAATLGQVPDADHADSADEARHSQTAVAADHASDATTVNGHSVGCGEGKRQFAGACWDVGLHATAMTPIEAAAVCASEGGELPKALALMAFNAQPGIPPDVGGEMTNDLRLESTDFWGIAIVEGTGHVRIIERTAKGQFRCVTPLIQ